MGVTEEAGKTVSSVAEALKGSPSCLAAVLLAAMFSGLSYMSLMGERRDMQERQLTLIKLCKFADNDDADNRSLPPYNNKTSRRGEDP